MVGILLHVEDSRVVGITPSMLESIRLYAKSFGVTSIHIVDGIEDGFFGSVGDSSIDFQRFTSLDAWWDAVGSGADAVVGLETQATIESVRHLPLCGLGSARRATRQALVLQVVPASSASGNTMFSQGPIHQPRLEEHHEPRGPLRDAL